MRVPSPDRVNTTHSLVVNADMDDEKPLPSEWFAKHFLNFLREWETRNQTETRSSSRIWGYRDFWNYCFRFSIYPKSMAPV